jgi:hypothetical protein
MTFPGNSVASERSCSGRNLVHDPKRNRLSLEKPNKLSFVHTNLRVLDRRGTTVSDASATNWHDDDALLEEELLWRERGCLFTGLGSGFASGTAIMVPGLTLRCR